MSCALSFNLDGVQRPLVFSNGVFDILHRGHVAYLERAKELGATLAVGINTDDSARRLGKGNDRPINTLADRMAVVAALRCVDMVAYFDQDTPMNLILQCRPDILVKGGDWPEDEIVGAKDVRGWGGTVVSLPFEHDRSTTALIERIRNTA